MNNKMEEKKKAMERKMNVAKSAKESKEQAKENTKQPLTYEQLNNVCQQLFQQNQKLKADVTELSNVAMFKRLDYLFKVVEFSSTFKDSDFVNSCMDEIKEALTVKEEDTEDNDKK